MSTTYDVSNVYDFLLHTPESGLRKILIEAKFSETHFNLLLKIVRQCSMEQFQNHFNNKDFPKIKTNANELKIKEQFWDSVIQALTHKGLLSVDSIKQAA